MIFNNNKVIVIIAPGNFGRKFRKVIRPPRLSVCLSGMRGPESMGRIFLIFCIKLNYNGTTKAHI